MRKIIYLLILLIILPVITAAETNFGQYKIDECINLVIPCDNCTYLTIITGSTPSPDSITYLLNYSTTEISDDVFNITFCDNELINKLGVYSLDICANPNALLFCDKLTYEISTTGTEVSQTQAIIYIIMFIGLLLIFIITIYGAIVFPWANPRDDEDYIIGLNDLKYVKVILWVAVYLELLFIVSILKNISGSFLPNEGTFYFFQTIYMFMLIGLLPFFPLLIFFTIVLWLSDKKTQKMLTRGIRVK